MFVYTKGPWQATNIPSQGWVIKGKVFTGFVDAELAHVNAPPDIRLILEDDNTISAVLAYEAYVPFPDYKLTEEQWEGNAHLISAAPDMYEALKELIFALARHEPCTVCKGTGERDLMGTKHQCEFCHGTKIDISTQHANARIALAKAEGKE